MYIKMYRHIRHLFPKSHSQCVRTPRYKTTSNSAYSSMPRGHGLHRRCRRRRRRRCWGHCHQTASAHRTNSIRSFHLRCMRACTPVQTTPTYTYTLLHKNTPHACAPTSLTAPASQPAARSFPEESRGGGYFRRRRQLDVSSRPRKRSQRSDLGDSMLVR